jgi:type I restriction enzyme S subunit
MGEGWQETSLGDVVELNSENTKGWPDAKQIRYIDLSSVTGERGINRDGLESLSYGTSPGRARRVVRTGDVLVATVRPYLRGFARVDSSLDGEVASTGFAVLRADSERCLPGYVWAITQTETFVNFLISRSTGSSYPAVRADDVAAYPLPLPSLAEQRRIADLVESVDSYIDALRTQADAASAARTSLLHELLNAGDDDWEDTTLGELVQMRIGAAFKSSVFRSASSGTRLLRGMNVGPDSTRWGETYFWPDEQLEGFERFLLNEGDLCIAMDATFTKAGAIRATSIEESDLPALLVQRVACLRVERAPLRDFIRLTVTSPDFRSHLLGHQTGAFAPHISGKDISSYRLRLPPESVQMQVVELVTSIEDTAARSEEALASATQFRRALLQELLSGNHEIPKSYDALLEAS